MNTINRYIVLLAVLALGGCTLSKDLQTPQADLPGSFRNAAAADTGSIADIPWKSFFTDASLQQLIDSAIVKNYDMQLALKNIGAAQLLVKQVRWNYLPAAGLNVSASSSRPSDNSVTGLSLASNGISAKHIEDYTADLAISWEADIWGKIRNQNKSALAAYLQTTEAKKLLQTAVVADVAQGYYNLLMLDAQLAIAQSNVRLNDSTLHIIQLQFNAGQVTSLAVQQAEAQQLAAAGLIPQFAQNIALQENALRLLAGELPARISREKTLNDFSVADHLSAGVPAGLVSRRPDVKSSELALTMANANVGINQAEMYPALRITADGGVNSFKAADWFNIPASLFGVVSGSVLQPLLNHKVLKTNFGIAKIDREKKVLQFRQTVLTAVDEVSGALVKIEQLKTEQDVAQRRVSTLQKATANANQLFKNGMANYLEVITAQGNVLQSELELASIKTARLNAVSELYRSLGGGWR